MTSPYTPHPTPATARPSNQEGDCPRDVEGRGHLAAVHPSAHEPGGFCSQQTTGIKTHSQGKGLSLFTDQQAEHQDGLAVPG